MKLFVKYSELTVETNPAKEEYGDWSTELHFSVEGIFLTKDRYFSYEEIEVDFEVSLGDELYVLCMIYSSGDSFGTCRGNGEVIWVFKDKALALKLAKEFEDSKEYSIVFTTESGNLVTLSNPASGYFENVSSMNIESFKVGK